MNGQMAAIMSLFISSRLLHFSTPSVPLPRTTVAAKPVPRIARKNIRRQPDGHYLCFFIPRQRSMLPANARPLLLASQRTEIEAAGWPQPAPHHPIKTSTAFHGGHEALYIVFTVHFLSTLRNSFVSHLSSAHQASRWWFDGTPAGTSTSTSTAACPLCQPC